MKNFRLRPLYFAIPLFLTCLIFAIEAFFSKHLSYVFDFVGYGGTFKYHDLKIMGLPAYWFMMLLGLVICIDTSFGQRKKYSFSQAEAAIIPIAFLIVSFIGGKLLYILENLKSVLENGIGFDGLSLFGAIFIVPLTAFLVTRVYSPSFYALLDFCTPFGLILLSCVRAGCFINGCCGAITLWRGNIPIILPIQLIEVVLDLLIMELCVYVKSKAGDGTMYPTFMISYGICRFCIEFLRKTPKMLWIFSNGQVFSIICITTGIALLLLKKAKYKK